MGRLFTGLIAVLITIHRIPRPWKKSRASERVEMNWYKRGAMKRRNA
jgi:hypothetical protein